MKKILVINTSSRFGGAEKSLQDLLRILKKSFIIWVVLPKEEGLYYELSKSYNVKVYNIHRLKKSKDLSYYFTTLFETFNTSNKIAKLIREEKIDLIYANANHSTLYAIIIKFFTGRKVIWHMRDNLHNKYLSFLFGLLSDKIICISEHLTRQIPFSNKKNIVYNGIDTDEWIPNPLLNKIKKELSLSQDTILVGQVGELIPWKNQTLLLDVAKILIVKNPKVFFIVIGVDTFNAFPDYNSELRKRIENEKLGGCITFLGYKENIKECLSEIDILIHLAEEEPFGRVLIEAMALKKPVVALNSGGPAEIVEDNESGFLVEKRDPTVIAQKLNRLSKDPNLRRKFGQNGRRIVKERFSINNLQQVQEIASSLV